MPVPADLLPTVERFGAERLAAQRERAEAARLAEAERQAQQERERLERVEAGAAGWRWARDVASEAALIALLASPDPDVVAEAARSVGVELAERPSAAFVVAFVRDAADLHGKVTAFL